VTADLLGIFGSLLGGLGLFLLAVGMMTDGLRLAAGSSLRNILAYWTDSSLRGVLSGLFMTAIVQSSSAVTVATIGFVNAGLLSMRQTLGIIYGANIGTSMTAWLVAVVGFNFNIQAFALPMIGIGMLIRLMNQSESRLSSLAFALVGFGLFFVGIDILKSAFEGIVASFDVTHFAMDGVEGLVLYLLLGVVMTVLTQSSSAAIALTITAAASCMLSLNSAAAMVIGANVGTSSTALLTTIGATANAKRVAWAQVIFNLVTALLAFVILPALFYLIQWLSGVFDLEAHISIKLALFHTVFNVFGVLCFLPINTIFARFLDRRFVAHEEQATQPKYLDNAIAVSPALAINALVMELKENAERVRNLHQIDFMQTTATAKTMRKDLSVITILSKQISEFIVTVEQNALSEEVSKHLALLLRIDEYLLTCAHTVNTIYLQYQHLDDAKLNTFKLDINLYKDSVLHNADLLADFDLEHLQRQAKANHDAVKSKLLNLGSRGQISFTTMTAVLDILREQLYMIQQWLKATNLLNQIDTQTQKAEQVDPADVDENS